MHLYQRNATHKMQFSPPPAPSSVMCVGKLLSKPLMLLKIRVFYFCNTWAGWIVQQQQPQQIEEEQLDIQEIRNADPEMRIV